MTVRPRAHTQICSFGPSIEFTAGSGPHDHQPYLRPGHLHIRPAVREDHVSDAALARVVRRRRDLREPPPEVAHLLVRDEREIRERKPEIPHVSGLVCPSVEISVLGATMPWEMRSRGSGSKPAPPLKLSC